MVYLIAQFGGEIFETTTLMNWRDNLPDDVVINDIDDLIKACRCGLAYSRTKSSKESLISAPMHLYLKNALNAF